MIISSDDNESETNANNTTKLGKETRTNEVA